jgi:predicted nucleotidyltransferase
MGTKTLTRDEVLERLYRAVNAMREVCEPEFVVLFGSYAYGEPHEGSDVDVLVVYSDETSDEERRKASSVLHQVFGTGLEVHPCTLSQWREALLKRNWFVAEITQERHPLVQPLGVERGLEGGANSHEQKSKPLSLWVVGLG